VVTALTPVEELHERLSLLDIRCVRNEAHLEGDTPTPPEMATVRFTNPKYFLDSEGGRFSALIEAELHFSDAADDPVASARVGYVVDSSLEPGAPPEDEAIAAYLRGNTFFLAYPYLREALQSAAVRIGMPAMPLPVLDRRQEMPSLIEIVRSE
jgi:hypothetical protein